MSVLTSPIVNVVTDPPATQLPEGVVYFELQDGELILADLTTPMEA